MRLARSAAVVALGLLLTSGAGASTNEPATDTFTRTPSFASQPVAGSKRYEFQLATSRTFSSGALITRKTTRVPAVSLAVALPWMTGTLYSLYARVRGLDPDGRPGPWGTPVGFNMRGRRSRSSSPHRPGSSNCRRSTARRRVRAIRDLYGGVLNKLPAVSYGPWSPTFTSTNPPLATSTLTPDESISDVTSTAADPAAHRVMPGF